MTLICDSLLSRNFQSFDNSNYNTQPQQQQQQTYGSPAGGGMGAPPAYDNQYYGNDNSISYTGQVFTPAPLPMDPTGGKGSYGNSGGSTDFDDEPPLLEGEGSFFLFLWLTERLILVLLFCLIAELGINPQHIIQKVSVRGGGLREGVSVVLLLLLESSWWMINRWPWRVGRITGIREEGSDESRMNVLRWREECPGDTFSLRSCC